MSDRLDYSIDGVRKAAEEMRADNKANEKNKELFIDYINNQLVPEWNTPQGKAAIEDLKGFAEKDFQDYINYLNDKIDALENIVIPALERINNA